MFSPLKVPPSFSGKGFKLALSVLTKSAKLITAPKTTAGVGGGLGSQVRGSGVGRVRNRDSVLGVILGLRFGGFGEFGGFGLLGSGWGQQLVLRDRNDIPDTKNKNIPDKTEQNKTRQDKARQLQDKTRLFQDKTRQDKTITRQDNHKTWQDNHKTMARQSQ